MNEGLLRADLRIKLCIPKQSGLTAHAIRNTIARRNIQGYWSVFKGDGKHGGLRENQQVDEVNR
jgi:hypothetical protein